MYLLWVSVLCYRAIGHKNSAKCRLSINLWVNWYRNIVQFHNFLVRLFPGKQTSGAFLFRWSTKSATKKCIYIWLVCKFCSWKEGIYYFVYWWHGLGIILWIHNYHNSRFIWGVVFDIHIYLLTGRKLDSDVFWSESVNVYVITRGWNNIFIYSACIGKLLNLIT